jgi:hypothetical protein
MSEMEILTPEEIDRARFLAACNEPTFQGNKYTIERLCNEVAKIVLAKDQQHEREAIAEAKREVRGLIAWLNEMLPKIKNGYTIGAISADGIIEEVFICDDDGDMIDETSLILKQSIGG